MNIFADCGSTLVRSNLLAIDLELLFKRKHLFIPFLHVIHDTTNC